MFRSGKDVICLMLSFFSFSFFFFIWIVVVRVRVSVIMIAVPACALLDGQEVLVREGNVLVARIPVLGMDNV
jgi:hypothetical protein